MLSWQETRRQNLQLRSPRADGSAWHDSSPNCQSTTTSAGSVFLWYVGGTRVLPQRRLFLTQTKQRHKNGAENLKKNPKEEEAASSASRAAARCFPPTCPSSASLAFFFYLSFSTLSLFSVTRKPIRARAFFLSSAITRLRFQRGLCQWHPRLETS